MCYTQHQCSDVASLVFSLSLALSLSYLSIYRYHYIDIYLSIYLLKQLPYLVRPKSVNFLLIYYHYMIYSLYLSFVTTPCPSARSMKDFIRQACILLNLQR
jgi:hypothetical protein